MSQYDESVANGEAQEIGAPKIPLKSRGAARIKKPPFGAASTIMRTTAAGTQEIVEAPPESGFAPWWRETGSIVAGGSGITGLWALAFSIYISASIGWGQLFKLLPDQFGSFMATFILPIAFIWVVIAFLDRGRELRRESAALRYHLEQLTYPAEFAEAQIASISDSLKVQARMLVDASDNAVKNMQKLQTGFLRDTEKLASVTGQLEAGAASAAGAVTEQVAKLQTVQVAKLQTVIDSAVDVNLKIEDALRRQHEFIRTASQKTLSDVVAQGQLLC